MKTKLTVGNSEYVLEDLISQSRSMITIGRETDEAFNVITTGEYWDVFQCQFNHTGNGWLLRNGQLRTECPKGIKSRLQHACQMCMGRCVNIRTANPRYSWRYPVQPTLLNGLPLSDDGVVVKDGDVITINNGESDFFIRICFVV